MNNIEDSNPKLKQALENQLNIFRSTELKSKIQSVGVWKEFKEGAVIVDFGAEVKVVPIVVSGRIKVVRESEAGDELFLYYLNPSQTCALSLQCCMANEPSAIRATADETTALIMIPIGQQESWMNEFDEWKNFIMKTFSYRFNELLKTIDGVVFQQLDQRLLEYLESKGRANKTKVLSTSHQEIANDLNSSREVISRLLKQFEKRGILKLSRNKIELM